ncbi:oxidoreductase [Methanofollis formosanus]|uniref:Oxidoreductase n=1 Tax=Methanofollis formosanus TaxID=299308 RepID=A0A8G1EF38_9EURY|nr:nitrogenase component 1 [Methanofollis formosanus]QYZ78508.1 oxidoreductase [Methanofollis formosanus]
MNSKTLHSSSQRYEGCTLTGALSITAGVEDAVTVVHGPEGCAHHNVSLLHAVMAEQGRPAVPRIVPTGLSEQGVIFGGEEDLAATLRAVADKRPGVIFVLTTCITETIGDDAASVCSEDYGVPVVLLPTAGFLGGCFSDGLNAALTAMAGLADPVEEAGETVTVIGEKNLEYEVEENFTEVERLLASLGLEVGLRFVRDVRYADLKQVGAGRLNILREPSLAPVGEMLKERFGTPYISSFPIGLEGSTAFLEEVGVLLDLRAEEAVRQEEERQRAMLASFADLRGSVFSLDPMTFRALECTPVRRVMEALDLQVDSDDAGVSLPYSPPVGTAGIRRLLHRWRRRVRA